MYPPPFAKPDMGIWARGHHQWIHESHDRGCAAWMIFSLRDCEQVDHALASIKLTHPQVFSVGQWRAGTAMTARDIPREITDVASEAGFADR
jgi:hypothetical protein